LASGLAFHVGVDGGTSQGLLLGEKLLGDALVRLCQVKGFDLILFACLSDWIENVVIRLEEVAWVGIAMI